MLVMPIRRPLYNLDPSIEPTCTASVSPLCPLPFFKIGQRHKKFGATRLD